MNTIRKFSLAFLILIVAGCGYELEGTRRAESLKSARTISISGFSNQTGEPGLGRMIAEALKGRFLRDGRLRVSTSSRADISLKVVLSAYRIAPIGFSQVDQVQRYRIALRARVELRDNVQDKVLVDQDLETDSEFRVSSSIALSDSTRSQANRQVADIFSADLVSLILEGF